MKRAMGVAALAATTASALAYLATKIIHERRIRRAALPREAINRWEGEGGALVPAAKHHRLE